MSFIFGFLLVFGGALSVGTCAWPLKACKVYGMEHVNFWSMIFGLLFLPWVTMFCICDVPSVLDLIGWKTFLFSNCFSLAWGIANVLAVICMVKIGFVLTGVLLGGTALIVSTLIPLIFKGSGVFANAPSIFSLEGLLSIVAVIIAVIAIVIISKAGTLKDQQLGKSGIEGENLTPAKNNFYKFMSIIAGVLSTGIFMLNTYCGADIIGAMEQVGVKGPLKGVSIWAIGMITGVLLNILYSLILMVKNKSFNKMCNFKEWTWACCDGLQFFLYLILFGFGTLLMGPLGASIGNGVSQCVQTGGQQFLGLAFGEWKGVTGKPIKMLIAGLTCLFIGILILSFK